MAAAPRTFHGWSALPNELKLEALSYHLTQEFTDAGYNAYAIDDTVHARLLAGDLSQIVSIKNCELVEFAIEAYCKSNTFKVDILDKRAFLKGNVSIISMRYPPTVRGARIRHIEMVAHECVFAYVVPDMLLPIQSGWRFLFDRKPTHIAGTASRPNANPPPDLAQSANLHTHFPNLYTLRIDMFLQDLTSEPDFEEDCCTTPPKLEQLDGWLAETTFKIKADKVDVVVDVAGAVYYYLDMRNCVEPFAACVHNMAMKKR
jgi:hypothetical protein